MPKSKNRKEHKKKASLRKEKFLEEKQKFEKKQRDMIMNLIEQEKKKGLFDNIPTFDGPLTDGPLFDLPNLNNVMSGPTI